MKIAIDVSPLEKSQNIAHKVRGSGFYLQNLKRSLLKYCSENEYIFFIQGDKLPDNIDLIHIPYFEPFFRTLHSYKQARTVVTVHDLTPLVFPEHFPYGVKGKIKWILQRNSLKKADIIITDSESSKKDIIRFTGIAEDKIRVVYLAAGEEYKRIQDSESRIKNLKKKYGLPDKFALYVGDATWNKNLPRLIKAVEKINIPLVMVGWALIQRNIDRSNPWNEDLIEVQKSCENNKNIVLPGFIPTEDLVCVYNFATVFVMPSIYEGFGLPVLEAMSCGCPVITTKQGSLPEVAGNAAYFVDAFNVDDIADGINNVFKDNKLQKRLSLSGIENSRKFFWEKTARETYSVYDKTIKKK